MGGHRRRRRAARLGCAPRPVGRAGGDAATGELGYIEPGQGAEEVERTVRESQFYLARVHLYNNRPDLAAPLLEQAFREEPEAERYGLRLAEAYRLLGRYDEAHAALDATAEGRIRGLRPVSPPPKQSSNAETPTRLWRRPRGRSHPRPAPPHRPWASQGAGVGSDGTPLPPWTVYLAEGKPEGLWLSSVWWRRLGRP